MHRIGLICVLLLIKTHACNPWHQPLPKHHDCPDRTRLTQQNGCERCVWGPKGLCGFRGPESGEPSFDVFTKPAFEFMKTHPRSNFDYFNKWCFSTTGQDKTFCSCLLNNSCFQFGVRWNKNNQSQRGFEPFCDKNWDEC